MANELVALRDERERTIATLSELFAHDHLDLDEFERRLTLAHRATTTPALREAASPGGAAGAARGEAEIAQAAAAARGVTMLLVAAMRPELLRLTEIK